MPTAAVFAALADPTRRTVFERLSVGPRPVTEIARGLPVSRPAVSQHLKVLRGAGLVTVEKHGRQQVYAVRREGLEEMRRWLDGFWDSALESYAEAVRAAVTEEENR
ncbi:MAG TPA: metalloregulator ArsR/SmtB family transcription factor [Pedococcus sp.]|nr:metalloregulator ArsR/SmtB family transcription factor [Pedococcus sp.]